MGPTKNPRIMAELASPVMPPRMPSGAARLIIA
jgi:hypothetical protein